MYELYEFPTPQFVKFVFVKLVKFVLSKGDRIMKRAYTIYYDDSGWSPKYNAMIYKYETGKYFDEES